MTQFQYVGIEAARLLVAGVAMASRRPSSRAAHGRRGALLMELIAATALFGILLTIVVPVVTGVAAIRETARQQQTAQIELGNVLEQIAARRVRGDRVRDIAGTMVLSPEVAALLPDARLAIDVSAPVDTSDAVRVSAGLTWSTGPDRPDGTAALHAFFVEATDAEVAQP